MLDQVAVVAGCALAYMSSGQGRYPVLVMHGGMGFDHSYLQPWLVPLGQVAEVVLYDHRGNGVSEAPADWSAVTHETWVWDAEALRAHLGHERVILFGHSYGGFLALEYALRFPERLAGLILCSTAPAMDHGADIVAASERRATAAQLATVLQMLSGPVADDAAFAAGMRAIMPLYFHAPAPALIDAVAGDIRFRVGAFNRAFFGCAPSYRVTERLGEIRVPTLVLGGTDDWITPFDKGPGLLGASIPGATVVRFEHSGHFPFAEEPAKFIDVVTEWIAARDCTP
jgi:proline iminopeptidase